MTNVVSQATGTAEVDVVEAPRQAFRTPFALTAAAVTANFDRFAITPMLVAIATTMHVKLAAVVTLAGGYALAYGLSQPAWGMLSDRVGRLTVARTALAIAALAGLASAAAPNLSTLVALRLVAGFAYGAVVPATISYIGDAVPPKHRQHSLADLMAALGVASGLAALFAGVVAGALSWRFVFVFPALAAVTAIVGLRGKPEPEREGVAGLRSQLAAVLRAPYAYLMTGIGVVEGAVLLGGLTFVAPALEHRGLSTTEAGALAALYGAATLAFTRAVRAASRRIPPHGLAAIGGVFVILGYAPAACFANVWTYTLVAVFMGAGWAFMHSTLQAWATSVVPEARGTAVSFYVAALFVGSALGASLGGAAAQHGQFGAIFGVAAVTSVPLTVAVVIGRRRFVARG